MERLVLPVLICSIVRASVCKCGGMNDRRRGDDDVMGGLVSEKIGKVEGGTPGSS